MRAAREVTARNTPEHIRKLLEDAKGDDTWLDLLIEGAKARGVDIDYRSPGIGRPSKAFSVEAFEQRMRKEHLDKIAEYNRLHQGDVDEARRVLGIDLKPGQSVPAQGFDGQKKYKTYPTEE